MDYLQNIVIEALNTGSLWQFILLFIAGILTSFSPCIIAILPVVVGIIAGYGSGGRKETIGLSFIFTLGITITYATLGLIAVAFGRIFGQVSSFWHWLIPILCITMGLILLGAIKLPSIGFKGKMPKYGGIIGVFLAGISFGVAASPCATPVLIAILAMISQSQNYLLGALMLFVYGIGYSLPILLLGIFAGWAKYTKWFAKRSRVINLICGTILISVGIYFALHYMGIL